MHSLVSHTKASQKEAELSHVWNFNHLQTDKLLIQQKQELEKPEGDTVVNNFNTMCACAHAYICSCFATQVVVFNISNVCDCMLTSVRVH